MCYNIQAGRLVASPSPKQRPGQACRPDGLNQTTTPARCQASAGVYHARSIEFPQHKGAHDCPHLCPRHRRPQPLPPLARGCPGGRSPLHHRHRRRRSGAERIKSYVPFQDIRPARLEPPSPDIVAHPSAQVLFLRAYHLKPLRGTAPLISFQRSRIIPKDYLFREGYHRQANPADYGLLPATMEIVLR